MSDQLDAHARPPETLRILFKKWQRSSPAELENSDGILDFSKPNTLVNQKVPQCDTTPDHIKSETFSQFLGEKWDMVLPSDRPISHIYHVDALPGLYIYPSLFPVGVQAELLNRLLHRDLSIETHKTNLHLHYEIPYQQQHPATSSSNSDASFFRYSSQTMLEPKDRSLHKSLTVRQMLERKLRWLTLGGQYDWTAKAYPSERPPVFPTDIHALIQSLWPDIDPQAAIVNFYTPGDTLSIHRDVSEACDQGLVSISIGCDAIFLIGNADGSSHTTLRLRSGDALLMSGEARFAWHAVPKIVAGTCPTELREWPAHSPDSIHEEWKGWLSNKRINLNVRQMQVN